MKAQRSNDRHTISERATHLPPWARSSLTFHDLIIQFNLVYICFLWQFSFPSNLSAKTDFTGKASDWWFGERVFIVMVKPRMVFWPKQSHSGQTYNVVSGSGGRRAGGGEIAFALNLTHQTRWIVWLPKSHLSLHKHASWSSDDL